MKNEKRKLHHKIGAIEFFLYNCSAGGSYRKSGLPKELLHLTRWVQFPGTCAILFANFHFYRENFFNLSLTFFNLNDVSTPYRNLKPDWKNSNKKAGPFLILPLQRKICISNSVAEFSPDPCQSNQTKTKKKHGGGFGDC